MVTATRLIRQAALLGPVSAPRDKIIIYEDVDTVPVNDKYCWLCGQPTDGQGVPTTKAIKPTFTNKDLARAPESKSVCADCVFCLSQKELRFYSILATETGMMHPGRAEIKALLLNPPEPPFVLTIAVSGQKHLTFRARVAYSREQFPVQFEEMQVIVQPEQLAQLLDPIENLYTVFSKDEILTGRYSQGRMRQIGLTTFQQLENQIADKRGSRLFELAVFVAQKREVEEVAQQTPRQEPKGKHQEVIQLGLDGLSDSRPAGD